MARYPFGTSPLSQPMVTSHQSHLKERTSMTNLSALFIFIEMYLKFRRNLGAVSIRKTVLPGMAIPMLKIRRPNGRLIFNMEITIRR